MNPSSPVGVPAPPGGLDAGGPQLPAETRIRRLGREKHQHEEEPGVELCAEAQERRPVSDFQKGFWNRWCPKDKVLKHGRRLRTGATPGAVVVV